MRIHSQTGLAILWPTLLLLLAGCAGQAPRVETDVPLPEAFSTGGDETLPDRWWLTLGDEQLDALIEQALADNPSLLAARARLDQAAALARSAGASKWPSLSVDAGAARSAVGTSTSAGDQTNWSTDLSLGAQASYEVDLWGRVGATADASALDALASNEDVRAAEITLTATVAETWYSLVAARERLALSRAQLEGDEQTLTVINAQYTNGHVGAADVLQQRQLVESKRGEIAMAEASVAVLAHGLAVLLGETPTSDAAAVEGDLIDLPPLPDTGIPADLVRRRPDLRAGFMSIQAADKRVAAAVADRFPRLSLSASASTDAADVDALFDNWVANLLANLTLPLIDGGSRAAEAERTRAVASEQVHDYTALVLDAVAEVEDALISEDRQAVYLASLDRQLEMSGRTVELVRQRYLNGDLDYLRVLEAVKSEQTLAQSRVEAKRQLISYRIQLCRALAGGWENESDNTGAATGD